MTFTTCTLSYFALICIAFYSLITQPDNNIRPTPQSCAIEKGGYEILSTNIPVSDITQLLLCMYSSRLLAQTLASTVEPLDSGQPSGQFKASNLIKGGVLILGVVFVHFSIYVAGTVSSVLIKGMSSFWWVSLQRDSMNCSTIYGTVATVEAVHGGSQTIVISAA